MIPKSKIRLSRYLRAQTTPYPEATRLLKRISFLLVIILAFGIYLVAKPKAKRPAVLPEVTEERQVLGQQKAAISPKLYKVKKGDTLFNLSERYNVSWQTLAEINNLKEPYLLKIGQEIKLP